MQADTVKLWASHLVAVVGALAGPVLLVYVFQNLNSIEGSEGFIALIATWIGASFQFLFGSEIAKASQRQTEKAAGLGPTMPPAFEDELPPEDIDPTIPEADRVGDIDDRP